MISIIPRKSEETGSCLNILLYGDCIEVVLYLHRDGVQETFVRFN